MKNKIKTLIIDSGGYKFRTAITHTLVYGVLGIKPSGEESSHWLNKQKIIRHFLNRQYDALSYVNDWREAFYQRTDLDIDAVNLENLVEFSKAMKKITEFDLIIVLHSATGDNMSPLLKSLHLFQKRRSKLIVFLGNEYDLMSEKFTFVRETGADYLCSQLPKATAEAVCNLGRTKILSLPMLLIHVCITRETSITVILILVFGERCTIVLLVTRNVTCLLSIWKKLHLKKV
jgi:hypothetical protein